MSCKVYRPRRRELDNAIYGVARGEEGALKTLYELSSGAVYAYALTVTGNMHVSQDVMQSTYIKIYEAAPNYVSQGKPMSWILTIAKNLCYDEFRAQSRLVPLTDEQLDDQLRTACADVTDRLVIKSCLKELSDDERSIVVMHALGGIKHREIAAQLGMPTNTVLSKYDRALNKLKKILEGDDDYD